HEIRTPINGIVGFADLLQHSPLDAEQRDYVNTIKESCSNLLTIVNDILDFSKIEAGKLIIDNVAFNLRDSVEEVLSLLAPTAYSKSLELIHLIYADVPLKLYGDPIRIRQLLTNLVHNAIKFTPSGRVVVRAMLEEETEADAVLRITVTDTGIGLTKDDQAKLFRAFSQADTSLTRRFGGTGLGLIICKKLIEQMGGSIGLDSEPEKGSTFWFTLRCQKQRRARRGAPTLRNPLAGKRVLLFDQEPLSRLATRHLLESWDMALTEIEDWDALLSVTSGGGRWDAIVVGLSRDELNSRVVQSHIPRIRALDVPLLAMASTVDRDELRTLYQRGVSICLPKAVRRKTMFREMSRLIAPESSRPPGATPRENPAIANQSPARPEIHVLVVDDNEINRKLVTAIAERYGAGVSEAADGRQAVEACRRRSYDVVFMDIHMPGMSGEAAADEIRRVTSKGHRPRIVALTANALPGERDRLLQSGMDECLIKPVSEEEVARALGGTGKTVPTGTERAADPDLRREMQRMLIDELPEHRRAIRHAYRRNRPDELRERVHKLHGAVSVCQIPSLKEACQRLETAIMQDDQSAVPGGFDQLMREIGNLLDDQKPGRRTMA
ncbi:MAG TPA: ATP-binding protein, partial [Wenzhouxiangella sp.]|nr:ATP-binding protein [Wenzhouxiangella sp.]